MVDSPLTLRIGQGYDIHRLVPVPDKTEAESPLTLGGLQITDSPYAVVAHSDGDVLLHALMDALLGALALGDIGEHFPPSNPAYRQASSIDFLNHVLALLAEKNARVMQVDSTIVLEKPKLGEHKLAIRQSLASLLNLSLDCVSVKAKTAEGLGALGRCEAVAASVSVLVNIFPLEL